MLTDTHTHLYHARLAPDLPEVIGRARQAGVTRIMMPAIDLASIDQALDLCDRHEGLFAMTALHPSETGSATAEDFSRVAALCQDARVVAVGESGLDYYWDRSFDAAQQEFFRLHIRLAMETDLPLILHTRDRQGRNEVHRDIVRILREEREAAPGRLRGIFHCYGGPAWVAEAAAELGFLLGIGGTLTFRNAGVDALVATVPMEQMVLETDAPFLAPVPYRGKRNEPAYILRVAEKMAAVKGISVEAVARQTTENALQLFRLD